LIESLQYKLDEVQVRLTYKNVLYSCENSMADDSTTERRWRPKNITDVLEDCFPTIHTTARDSKTLDFIPTEIP
jgi:hypothetical protein